MLRKVMIGKLESNGGEWDPMGSNGFVIDDLIIGHIGSLYKMQENPETCILSIEVVWEVIFKRFCGFNTSRMIETIFQIDLAIDQTPSTSANISKPECLCFGEFLNVICCCSLILVVVLFYFYMFAFVLVYVFVFICYCQHIGAYF